MAITISGDGIATATFTPIPGTLKTRFDNDDRGGSIEPLVRAARGVSGECRVLLDSASFTLENALQLVSPAGAGSFTVSGDVSCANALVEVEVAGNATQSVVIRWKGN